MLDDLSWHLLRPAAGVAATPSVETKMDARDIARLAANEDRSVVPEPAVVDGHHQELRLVSKAIAGVILVARIDDESDRLKAADGPGRCLHLITKSVDVRSDLLFDRRPRQQRAGVPLEAARHDVTVFKRRRPDRRRILVCHQGFLLS